MKTETNNSKKREPKKKLSTLELAMKYPSGDAFKNLHLLLEPHEIPLNISK